MSGYGDNVAELRKDHKESQQSLADAIGVTRVTVAKWETGKAELKAENIVKIAEYYHVSTDALLHGTDNKEALSIVYESGLSGKAAERLKNDDSLLQFVNALLTTDSGLEFLKWSNEYLHSVMPSGKAIAKSLQPKQIGPMEIDYVDYLQYRAITSLKPCLDDLAKTFEEV